MNTVRQLGRIMPQGRIFAGLFAGLVFIFVPAWNITGQAQMPPIEPGVSQELAKWRAARYSDVRYKLNLTLEKMSPVLKGTIEIRLRVSEPPASAGSRKVGVDGPMIILDWRRLKGHEDKSTISNVALNGKPAHALTNWPPAYAGGSDTEHLIFRDGVVLGENLIKLDFTSPILTSGSAITRYIDKEDGSEYIYSLFVPSDASTAFPVFDQPDLKARFTLNIQAPSPWKVATNSVLERDIGIRGEGFSTHAPWSGDTKATFTYDFPETKPISTYVFAFAAGPWEKVSAGATEGGNASGSERVSTSASTQGRDTLPTGRVSASVSDGSIYLRRSQAKKFGAHAAEVFRLNREAIKYFEQYFDYKFPFPKYDLVLIPEFPFGGMEHAGATFLRESAIIFPQEPTKGDHISRANLIFHEAAHQWFGDTVTMRWFDDLWLKEGFATFMAYKALERVMPEANAWKVFYERVKQAAYQTDSTRGTTAIYQPIANLSAAKSAYGNIVYNKAPAFLRQAEFYLGEDKFQTAVRAFLKKNEFKNAGWEDLVKEFEATAGKVLEEDFAKVPGQSIEKWAKTWVERRGLSVFRVTRFASGGFSISQESPLSEYGSSHLKFQIQVAYEDAVTRPEKVWMIREERMALPSMLMGGRAIDWIFPNYQDYGYGIFLLDDKSREYVLKNIQNEKDPFLRSMMWGALWESVREGELDPKVYVELAIKNLPSENDETMTASIIGRVGTAMNYYLDAPGRNPSVNERVSVDPKSSASNRNTLPNGRVSARFEDVLLERMRSAATAGERQTFFRAFVANAATEKAGAVLKQMLREGGNPSRSEGAPRADSQQGTLPTGRDSASAHAISLRTKDKFDIVTRLLILNDADAMRLLADLEKTEMSDDAKRYAYAARAGIATAENKAKYWDDFVNNKTISESWIEAAFGPWNSIRHSELTLPYLERALKELPNHKRSRKIFFVNGWLGAFIGGQRGEEALSIVNKFLADNPNLDNDLRLKILENVDLIERAVRIRYKYKN